MATGRPEKVPRGDGAGPNPGESRRRRVTPAAPGMTVERVMGLMTNRLSGAPGAARHVLDDEHVTVVTDGTGPQRTAREGGSQPLASVGGSPRREDRVKRCRGGVDPSELAVRCRCPRKP